MPKYIYLYSKIFFMFCLIFISSLISMFAKLIHPTVIILISLLFSCLICSFTFYFMRVFYKNNINNFYYLKILFIFLIIFIFSTQAIYINIINSIIITLILLLNSYLAWSLIFYYLFFYDYLKLYENLR
jgi:hypothetical protein